MCGDHPGDGRVKVREGRFGEITEILAWYEYINDVILDHLDDEIKSTNKSGVWRYLISFKVKKKFKTNVSWECHTRRFKLST